MIKVTPLTDLQTENFTALFKCYYAELGCADDAEQLVQEYVLPDLWQGCCTWICCTTAAVA